MNFAYVAVLLLSSTVMAFGIGNSVAVVVIFFLQYFLCRKT